MVYKALYRTYRPQNFSEVVGQDHIIRTLQNSIVNNKTSHAYLFSGPRGTGKTSVARIFAKALNCSSPKGMEPCGECLSCQEISQGISPDVVEIDAASNNGVDEIREIRDKVKFLPGGSKYKIYIIDEVHMLSQGAFNALLKTLEEPPKHVIFILATTEPHKVLPTILSRCQRFDFKTLSVQEIASLIRSVSLKEGFHISEEAIIAISEGAEGGMRDALSYLDQAASFTDKEITIDDVNSVTGNLNFDKIVELAKYFEEKSINQALKTINDLVIMGKEINKIVSSLLQFYRDCLLYKNIDVSMFSKYIFEKEDFKDLASKIAVNKIFYYIDVLSDVQSKIKLSSTPTIYLEVAAIKMINSTDDDFSYNKRIKELEDKISNVSFDANGTPSSVDNSEKVNSIELKLNKVINELSKLELHKLNEKVESLEKLTPTNNVDYTKYENDLEVLKQNYINLESKINNNSQNNQSFSSSDYDDSISSLKVELNNLKSELNDVKNNSIHSYGENTLNNDIEDRIQKLKNIILGMQSDMYAFRNSKIESGAINLEQVKSELDDIYLNKFASIEETLKDIKSRSSVSSNASNNDDLKYELDVVKEKVSSIESKVYKLMSGELEKVESKKPKAKVNRKQIVLFGDEIMNLNDFKKPVKDSIDFEDNKDDEVTSEEDLDVVEDLSSNETNDNNDEGSSSLFDTDIEENEDLESDYQENESSITENSKDDDYLDSEYMEDEIDEVEVVPTKEEAKPIKTINTGSEEIIEREHSQLVRKINVDPAPAVEERHEILHQIPQVEKEEKITKTNQDSQTTTKEYKLPDDMANDEFSRYSVTVLERILHDSRSEIARTDKTRLMNLWKNLDRSVPQSQSHIATLLQDGKLVATGKKEFVLVYPNAALCNQVMRLSFKKESLKLLYDFLGDTYNYFAIPENAWLEKRTEYINQYNIGTRYPKLTPILDTNLNVLDENKEYLKKQDSSRSKAISFFGEELVKVE